MKKNLLLSALITIFISGSAFAAFDGIWQIVNTHTVPTKGERLVVPDIYKVYLLNDAYIKDMLFKVADNRNDAATISLPAPDGSMHYFRIWETPVMHPELAARYPGIRNFTAVSVDNPAVTAKVNYTYKGFNAMVYDGDNTYLVDPYSNTNDGYYVSYYKRDYPRTEIHNFNCGTSDTKEVISEDMMQLGKPAPRAAHKPNGSTTRTFRLALSCTGEYAKAVDGSNPSKPNVISAMVKTLTRVTGILERELGVSLQLISNNDQLVYLDPTTDPFSTAENTVIGNSTQTANQTNITNVIGNGNYDIGHIFCSGDGGIADLEAVCDIGHQARAATGSANPVGDAFAVDYVVHEMGHQLGAEHTFNFNNGGACNGNAVMSSAYEPGSGTTIMAYAGLCSGNDIQQHSDAYFHSKSLDQMTIFVGSLLPTCGTSSSSGNNPPSVQNIQAIYNIPVKTPFELEAPLAVDTDHDTLTYCWEEYDLGDFGKSIAATKYGPIFRSFKATGSRWRVFPVMDSIRANTLSYLGEKLPEVTRNMHFRLVVRDVLSGMGTYNWSDNTVDLQVTEQAGPFKVTGPNQHSDYWRIGNTYTVTWDVSNTDQAPVNCSKVNIYLSLDDGVTWPITLLANTPNDGSETITVPSGSYTGSARVKVKGADNVFFDISNDGFVINDWPDSVNDVDGIGIIKIYPVPAKGTVHIDLVDGGYYDLRMSNAVGQVVWTGTIEQSTTIDVSHFASGVYHLSFISKSTGKTAVRKVVIE